MSVEQAKAACERVMKHTAGPWTVPHFARNDVKCDCGYVFSDHQSGEGSICVVNYSKDQYDGYEPIEVAQANAKIIAAAPEMLDFVMKFIDQYNKPEVDIDPLYKQAVELLDKATK